MMPLNEFSSDSVGFLLQETAVEFEPELISDNGKVASFRATLQDTSQNRNGRIYKKAVLESAIRSVPVQERLRTRTFYGEANHPFVADLKRQMTVDGTRVSHLVTSIDGPSDAGVVRGVVETAATQAGRDMRGLIVENKSTAAFSMRGLGQAKRIPGSDLLEVAAPLALVTYDWVTYPSHPSAYMDTAKSGGHIVAVESCAVAEFVRDRSANVRAIVEQFELDVTEITLSEDQRLAILRGNDLIAAAIIEKDVRAEFRGVVLG